MSRQSEGTEVSFMHNGLDVLKLIQVTLERSGDTQKALMERAGLAPRYLHRFKDAKSGPNLATLRRLHSAGVPIECLFKPTDESAGKSSPYVELATELRAQRERLPVGRVAASAQLTRMAECCDMLRWNGEATPAWLGLEVSENTIVLTEGENSRSQLHNRILSWTGAMIAIRSQVTGELTRAQALELYFRAIELRSEGRPESDAFLAARRDGQVTFEYFFDVVGDLWSIPFAIEQDAGRRPTVDFLVANRDSVWSTGLAVCSWILASGV